MDTQQDSGNSVNYITPALASQQLFESLFDHQPHTDTRTPADVRNGVTRA